MLIRETAESDLPAILRVHRLAFGQEEEAGLTEAILRDPSAQPVVSLLAMVDGEPAGHILFSRARLFGPEPSDPRSASPEAGPAAAILAPLAVVPALQGQGIGGALIRRGLEDLSRAGTALVFVLGYPAYYQRHGFTTAGRLGFAAPYPIAERNAEAWMVQMLGDDSPGKGDWRVTCADTLNKPEYWVE
ncbi:GNAT family N-acetyltransferase [Pelagibius sp.]|uniref:GNAT family N-acetyltransferase n=1 Tax=Pelagibius sp. TaxID=1931238 RepID=UPI00261A63B7|nr:N-acetyltransferase [Pelagibius sp.]